MTRTKRQIHGGHGLMVPVLHNMPEWIVNSADKKRKHQEQEN